MSIARPFISDELECVTRASRKDLVVYHMQGAVPYRLPPSGQN